MKSVVLIFTKYDLEGPSSRIRHIVPSAYSELNKDIALKPLLGNYYFKSNGLFKLAYVAFCYLKRIVSLSINLSKNRIIEYELFPYLPYWVENVFLKQCRYILDYDDPIFLNDVKKHRCLSAGADLITAGNISIAHYFQSNGIKNNVKLNYTPVYKDKDAYKNDWGTGEERFTIGWIGSKTTSPFLDELFDVLMSFSKDHTGVRFLFIGYYGTKFKNIRNVEIITYDDDHYVNTLLEFDVGLMPGNNSDTFNYKSAYKFIQYIYYAIPSIAFRNEVSKDVNQGLKNLLYSNTKQLYDHLTLLINDRRKLAEIGECNYINREKYSIDAYLMSYNHCIDRLLTKDSQPVVGPNLLS